MTESGDRLLLPCLLCDGPCDLDGRYCSRCACPHCRGRGAGCTACGEAGHVPLLLTISDEERGRLAARLQDHQDLFGSSPVVAEAELTRRGLAAVTVQHGRASGGQDVDQVRTALIALADQCGPVHTVRPGASFTTILFQGPPDTVAEFIRRLAPTAPPEWIITPTVRPEPPSE